MRHADRWTFQAIVKPSKRFERLVRPKLPKPFKLSAKAGTIMHDEMVSADAAERGKTTPSTEPL